MVFHQTWESWAVSSKNSFLMWELMHCRRSPNCARARICGFSYCCPQIKPQQQNKKAQPIKGCGGKYIGLQPGSTVTLSVSVQGRTATFVCLRALLCEHAFIWLFNYHLLCECIESNASEDQCICMHLFHQGLGHIGCRLGYEKERKCFSSSPLVGSSQQAFHKL